MNADPPIIQYVLLPDGSYAALIRSMTWGDVIIGFLLTIIVFLWLWSLWRRV